MRLVLSQWRATSSFVSKEGDISTLREEMLYAACVFS
jgi:hypothetical protein